MDREGGIANGRIWSAEKETKVKVHGYKIARHSL